MALQRCHEQADGGTCEQTCEHIEDLRANLRAYSKLASNRILWPTLIVPTLHTGSVQDFSPYSLLITSAHQWPYLRRLHSCSSRSHSYPSISSARAAPPVQQAEAFLEVLPDGACRVKGPTGASIKTAAAGQLTMLPAPPLPRGHQPPIGAVPTAAPTPPAAQPPTGDE